MLKLLELELVRVTNQLVQIKLALFSKRRTSGETEGIYRHVLCSGARIEYKQQSTGSNPGPAVRLCTNNDKTYLLGSKF